MRLRRSDTFSRSAPLDPMPMCTPSTPGSGPSKKDAEVETSLAALAYFSKSVHALVIPHVLNAPGLHSGLPAAEQDRRRSFGSSLHVCVFSHVLLFSSPSRHGIVDPTGLHDSYRGDLSQEAQQTRTSSCWTSCPWGLGGGPWKTIMDPELRCECGAVVARNDGLGLFADEATFMEESTMDDVQRRMSVEAYARTPAMPPAGGRRR
ncbi:hypothetical protein PAPYR_12480 [Paratrimastix pyriformis]|uniref:Uncharacterized protein n=1 Tax=Paratrimastix pyriformis TaxID=342808 RepID=A0ABQ8U750_9EUKA|nr:hypothetical protein PAPYR_12480 [Paratrimastix pyriformis]